MAIRFHNQATTVNLKKKRKLATYLVSLVQKHCTNVQTINLQYIFCTDDYLIKMNQAYLKHDTYTDIISFDLSNSAIEMIGEMYISIDRVKENATLFGVSFNQELHRVIFHGALHLCGFGDKSKDEKIRMTALENECIENYFKN